MTATEREELRKAAGQNAGRDRPRPGDGTVGGTAELSESAAGWSLTLSLDARTAAALRDGLSQAGRSQVEIHGIAVSITPNLVPGEPFPLQYAGPRHRPGPAGRQGRPIRASAG